MKKVKLKIIKIEYMLVIFAGIIFSYVLTNMLLSSQINGDRVLAQGQTFEASNAAIYRHDKDWFYDSEQDLHRILSNNAKKNLGRWNEEVDFSCIFLDLECLNRDKAEWFINTYDKENNFLEQQVITVQNGENWIELNTAIPFRKYEIAIVGAKGMEFRINKICLYEEVPQKKQLALYMCGIFVAFCFVAVLIQRKGKFTLFGGQILRWIQNFLEFCYTLVGNRESRKRGFGWEEKKKDRVRIFLFLILFVYMLLVYNLDLYKPQEYFKYHGLIVSILLLVITLISKEGTLKPQKYDYHKLKWWYAFWGITCISDFVVTKRLQFVGWIMLLAVGFFMFVWKQMKFPEKIVYNMLVAAEILAVGGMLYTMFCRTKYDGLLYNGYMSSASDFGVISAFLCMIFGLELYDRLRYKEYGKKLLFYTCGLAVLLVQVLLSGNMAAIIFAGIIAVLVFCAVWKEFLSVGRKIKIRLWCYGGLGIILAGIYYLAVKDLPEILNMAVLYKNDTYESVKEPWVIEILAADGNPVYQKVKYHSIKDTLQIWRAYIREWNIFGHKNSDLGIWNKAYSINNQLLQVIYRYGLIIVIPYIGLFWQLVKQIYCKRKKLNKMDGLALGMLIFWCLVGSFAAIEYPFYQPAWIMMYLILGMYIFAIDKKEEYVL